MKRSTNWLILALILLLLLAACRVGQPPGADSTNPPTEATAAEPPVEPGSTSTPDLRPTAGPIPTGAPNPAGHPRLWFTAADLPRLQSWANDANPLWQEGLARVAENAKAAMDSGDVPGKDCGSRGYEEFATEMYGELFGFLSLVHPDPTARADYAGRARRLLMVVMDAAAKGPSDSQNYRCADASIYPPFRNPEFYTADSDRARWHGEAYPLIVDWIYPSLSVQDKATIRKVFLRWSQEIVTAGYHHPEPVGLLNTPDLYADRDQLRWSGNNYFTAHMRNLGLMAMALNPADDPDGALHAYLDQATGSWLYLFDHLTRTDSAGGLLPEGFEYSPQTASYALEFLLALHTAGQDDPARRGPQVSLPGNPFWADMISAYFHSISPATTLQPDQPDLGPVHLPAFYGDSVSYSLEDFIDAFGAMGLYDQATGNLAQLQVLRWIERETPAGGAEHLLERVGNPDEFRHAILYFTLFDPQVAPAPDPRPGLPLDFFAPGMHKLFGRTAWDDGAAWFVYSLSWNRIDHQQADGNHFEYYRRGEWLTKVRTGYADTAEGIASSEFRNLPAIQNDRPDRDPTDYRTDLWQRGSQWNLNPSGDPQLDAYSASPIFDYAQGDATNLYNDSYENVTDVLLASRSILWLKPDFIVVYDRLATKTAGRFKRWWLQLPTVPRIDGKRAVMTTSTGQQLFVSALLPADAELSAVPKADAHVEQTVAVNEPMTARLKIEAPGGPPQVQFLNVLQGADPGANTAPVELLRSFDGAFEGASIAGQYVVLFPRQPGPFQGLTYTAPAGVSLQLITGLSPSNGYTVQIQKSTAGLQVTIASGGDLQSDSGGVLVIK